MHSTDIAVRLAALLSRRDAMLRRHDAEYGSCADDGDVDGLGAPARRPVGNAPRVAHSESTVRACSGQDATARQPLTRDEHRPIIFGNQLNAREILQHDARLVAELHPDHAAAGGPLPSLPTAPAAAPIQAPTVEVEADPIGHALGSVLTRGSRVRGAAPESSGAAPGASLLAVVEASPDLSGAVDVAGNQPGDPADANGTTGAAADGPSSSPQPLRLLTRAERDALREARRVERAASEERAAMARAERRSEDSAKWREKRRLEDEESRRRWAWNQARGFTEEPTGDDAVVLPFRPRAAPATPFDGLEICR